VEQFLFVFDLRRTSPTVWTMSLRCSGPAPFPGAPLMTANLKREQAGVPGWIVLPRRDTKIGLLTVFACEIES